MREEASMGKHRELQNQAVIYRNMTKIFNEAVKRFGEKKVRDYFNKKSYKIEWQ